MHVMTEVLENIHGLIIIVRKDVQCDYCSLETDPNVFHILAAKWHGALQLMLLRAFVFGTINISTYEAGAVWRFHVAFARKYLTESKSTIARMCC